MNPRGRPPLPPEQGKRASYATRTTPQMRAALEAEAARTGRSVSEVAERWLEQGRTVDRLMRLFSGRNPP